MQASTQQGRRPRRYTPSARDRYEAANRAAARLIAADPERYEPGSLMALWAAAVLQTGDREEQPWELVA